MPFDFSSDTSSLQPSYDPSKYALQVALEEEMTSAGKARLEAAINAAAADNRASETHAGNRLLLAAVPPVAKAIEDYLVGSRTGKAGRLQAAAKLLEGMGAQVVAYITARMVLDRIGVQPSLTRMAAVVGDAVEDEARFCAYESASPDEYKKTTKHLKGSTHRRHRTAVTVYQMNKHGVEWNDWDENQRINLGIKLVELFSETTGIVEIQQIEGGQYLVVPTKDTLDKLAKANAMHALMTPVFLPCIIPPKPWTTPVSGGYHSNRVRRIKLVRTRSKGLMEELFGVDLSAVYSAVNAVQATPWRVNGAVYEIAKHMWENSIGMGTVLPARENDEQPPKPGWLALRSRLDKTPMTEQQKADFIDWKNEASQAHKRFARAVSRRLQVSRILGMAERFVAEPEIYFPHTLDFRGRIYSQVSFLSPQGTDLAKGMLAFAHGKPLGEHGAYWLAVHGANSFGFDKATLEERNQWVADHEAQILECAADPPSTSFWRDADTPWQFLAFCYEWAGYKREGGAFVSSLPVGLDGSCNGIQHFSAMMRDPIGGAEVNLVPGEKPSDIYRRVAEVAEGYLRLFSTTCDTEEERKLAQAWLAFGIDRKVTKRSVMVVPYGGTYMAAKGYVEEAVLEAGRPLPVNPKDRSAFSKAVHFLTKAIWRAVGDVVVGARECMAWLQACARLAVKTNLPINWTAPSGWRVQQTYHETTSRRVEVKLWGTKVYMRIAGDTEEIDTAKQVTGVAPNFVHSMDAAALIGCVNLASENGLTAFAMVHDSYGTLAAHTDQLAACLRHAFVDMYESRDVLAEFRENIVAMLPPELAAEVPPCPPRGSLDLSAVIRSDFFFA